MTLTSIHIVYTTVATSEDAKALVFGALERKLTVCANIHEITSYFYWEDQINDTKEQAILFKTTAACVDGLVSWLKVNHSYKTPSILNWVAGATSSFHSYMKEILG